MSNKEGAQANPDGPIIEKKVTNGKTWMVKKYTAEHRKPPVTVVPRSSYVPGFSGGNASANDCPKCGFLAFGWSKECSKCGAPLE